MSSLATQCILDAFNFTPGELLRTPDSIKDFGMLCDQKGISQNMEAMQCGTFSQFTRPIEEYIEDCISKTLSSATLVATDIQYVVFATMDRTLRYLKIDFVRRVLEMAGLSKCVPILMTMQQCVSSITAVDYAAHLVRNLNIERVLIVAFDFIVDDAERVHSFAIFGDAVATCVVKQQHSSGLEIMSYGIDIDVDGVLSKDTFSSRRRLMTTVLDRAMQVAGRSVRQIDKCFSMNLFAPISIFNAGLCGIDRKQIVTDSRRQFGHCGNCDWMMNLVGYEQEAGTQLGKNYLIQAHAPGIYACCLLQRR